MPDSAWTGHPACPTKTIVFGMNTMFAVRQFLPETLEMARGRGFRVVVLAPPGEPLPGIETCAVPMKREISPLSDLAVLVRIWKILRSVRPEIVNMSTPKMGLLGGLAALLAGVPHRIYTLRGLRYQTTRSWKRALLVLCERIACACARQVICISRSVKEAVTRDRIVAEKKTLLLGNRVSEGISLRGRAAAPAELALARSERVIGFVGRLTRDKGIEDLIEAFRLLRTDGLDVQLLLLGDLEAGDPIDPRVIETVRSHPHIRWLGPVPDASPYYPLMDVFVFPTHREGLGRVLLEAAAAGKPVVSTRTTGVVDVVVHGATGILVPPRSPKALARATRLILANPNLAARMGRRARQHVEHHFDNSIYLARLGSVLDSVARTTKAPPMTVRSPSM